MLISVTRDWNQDTMGVNVRCRRLTRQCSVPPGQRSNSEETRCGPGITES